MIKSNTAPGRDGFIPEFYKSFKHLLVGPLTQLCNMTIHTASMPLTWSEANIILIHKPEKDPLDPASYRPIALLNTDAKIFTRTLATRLNKIITKYVHTDQTGFMPNRHLVDNIR